MDQEAGFELNADCKQIGEMTRSWERTSKLIPVGGDGLSQALEHEVLEINKGQVM